MNVPLTESQEQHHEEMIESFFARIGCSPRGVNAAMRGRLSEPSTNLKRNPFAETQPATPDRDAWLQAKTGGKTGTLDLTTGKFTEARGSAPVEPDATAMENLDHMTEASFRGLGLSESAARVAAKGRPNVV